MSTTLCPYQWFHYLRFFRPYTLIVNGSPLNTVLKFTPAKGGGWAESRHRVLPSPSPSETDLCNSNGSSKLDLLALSPEFRMDTNERKPFNKLAPPIWGDHLRVPSFAPLRRHNSLDGRSPSKHDGSRRQESMV